jgi:octaprenyl-diphosphate synthase
LVHAGGKRIRPLLTLAGARLFGAINPATIKLAASVEFIHTATLLHDDVVDGSAQRRGRDTANAVWGNKAPILVGDFLFARAFELMVEADSLETLNILATASARIAEGEVLQLTSAHDVGLSLDTYFRIIEAKTAVLFEAALQVGALSAGATKEQAKNAGLFGMGFGCAFQIIDDYLDYAGEQAIIGKAPGDDFREGKVTMPVILSMQANRQTQEQLTALFQSQQRELYFDKSYAYDYATQAIAGLAGLESRTKDMLTSLSQEALNRIN